MKIPDKYLPIMPYLILRDAEKFARFMKEVFGATEQMIVPAERGIMHGELRIGNAVVMFADSGEEFKPSPSGMFIFVDDVDDVYQKALQNGATSLQPLEKRDYGYGGGFEDPFGNQWWVNEGS
ncbi:Glyoxalase family protein [Fulvivirga imtechensis AK7]|uniref:Glyoxalase family protein n=1 Tax=Fulvivirga imtechensis AK7 TaxID=1237149 RepID=L8JJH7_9BACT|nr:VOC family protein [Fulvivirga imtechensis]ELR68955.1 Glyoxalase family protein [Fulvivirga imtechensis AK7]